MKNIVFLFLSFFLTFTAFAQEHEEELATQDAKAREKITSIKIAFITERLELTPEQAEKFWPVYREFSTKREELRLQMKDKRKNPDPNKTIDQNDKEELELRLKVRQQELDLEKEYSGKLLNVVPAQKVMSLRKAEDDFRKLLM